MVSCALLVGCLGTVDDEVDETFAEDAGFVTAVDGGGVILHDAGAVVDGGRADGGSTQPPIDAGSSMTTDAGAAGRDGAVPTDAAAPAVDAGSTVDAAGPVDDSVPAGAHCDPVRNWPAAWSAFEQEVLRLTNEARAVGHNCDSKGNFGATKPLTMDPKLRCSARLHSKYMADNNEFAHNQAKTGLDPFERMTAAGYKFKGASENIAAGQPTPKAVVDGWLESDGHCLNIMSPGSVHLGVGLVIPAAGSGARYGQYWTQNFASPL